MRIEPLVSAGGSKPQGLKPACLFARDGTAEAKPFPKRICEFVPTAATDNWQVLSSS